MPSHAVKSKWHRHLYKTSLKRRPALAGSLSSKTKQDVESPKRLQANGIPVKIVKENISKSRHMRNLCNFTHVKSSGWLESYYRLVIYWIHHGFFNLRGTYGEEVDISIHCNANVLPGGWLRCSSYGSKNTIMRIPFSNKSAPKMRKYLKYGLYARESALDYLGSSPMSLYLQKESLQVSGTYKLSTPMFDSR